MAFAVQHHPAPARAGFIRSLNGRWHERAMWIFVAIVIAHWAEHLFQTYPIYFLTNDKEQAGVTCSCAVGRNPAPE